MSSTPRARPAPQPTVQLGVRIAPDLKHRVSRLAASRGCYETLIVEEALGAYLDSAEAAGGEVDVPRGRKVAP